MTSFRFGALAAAVTLALACGRSDKSAPDSTRPAVASSAANGALLGDTARTQAATKTPPTAGGPGTGTLVLPNGSGTSATSAAAPGVPRGAPPNPNDTAGTANGRAGAAAIADTTHAAAPAAQRPIAVAAAPQASLVKPAAAPRGAIPYLAGERLVYDVKFSSIDVGDAVMEVLGLENVRGRQALHVRFNVKGGTFLYKVNDRYESWIDTLNLVSLRHWQQIDEGNYERQRRYEIMPELGTYKENDKPEQPTVAEPLDDGSFFYFIRTIPLEVGKTYSFDRYFKPDRNPVTVTVVRRERIKVPAGTFNAIVLHPTIKAKGVFGEGGQAEIWLTDDSTKMMLQMKSKLKIGSLNLYLKSIRRSGS